MSFTVGSLFDGSGGFPLAAFECGGTPVWASEIEPYPVAVTKSRFPYMKHLGSVTDIKGNEIEPVDVITFGSPCQDLSVAGKRAGLKHEDNGDDETTRSGLFMEAVRIIKEMREATNGKYPRFAVWENVPGAFSSNQGEDFRIVLEELIKIVEPTAVMPNVPSFGWPYADSFVGDGWNLAWRVFDAQFWGVPQRRRRIYLVLDLGGECSREVLFEREGLRGYFTQGRTPWEETSRYVEDGSGTADRERNCVAVGFTCGVIAIENHPNDSRVNIDESGTIQTLTGRMGTGGGNVPMVMEQTIALEGNGSRPSHHGDGYAVSDKSYTLNTTEVHGVCYEEERPIENNRAFYNQGENALYDPQYYENGIVPTIVAKGPSAVCTRYIVRRLTPTECARLQGFPDKWGHPDKKDDFTDEEYRFWLEVRNTKAAIEGKAVKDYTKKQMLTWYNKLHTDSSEYKMWGNGIALPNALFVMGGIAEVLNR